VAVGGWGWWSTRKMARLARHRPPPPGSPAA
jgi:hypothetical protein